MKWWRNSHNKTFIKAHFIADMLLWRTSYLDPNYRSELTSVQSERNNRAYKTFLVRSLHKFYFRQCFTVSFKFYLSLFDFFSELNGFFRFIKNENSLRFRVRILLHGWYISQLQKCPKHNGVGREIWMQSMNMNEIWIHMPDHLVFTVRIRTNCSSSIPSTSLVDVHAL